MVIRDKGTLNGGIDYAAERRGEEEMMVDVALEIRRAYENRVTLD